MIFTQYDTADYRKIIKGPNAINANDNRQPVFAAA